MNDKLWMKLSVLVATMMVAFSLIGTGAQAVSLHPDVLEKMRAEGTLDEHVAMMKDARERGMWSHSEHVTRNSLSMTSEPETLRVLILLIDFSDNQWQSGPNGTPEFFEELIFSEGVLEYGSMKEYYLENSYDNFVLTGEVYDWYRMPQTYAYYVNGQSGTGSYPRNTQKMAEDAVMIANPDIDYADYDNDGDSWVEGLIIVHAGPGGETSGSPNDIHSHMWYMRSIQNYDGVRLLPYTVVPEEHPDADGLVNIGVICHEFGHLGFGLPDLYDTDYSSTGVGRWSIMASGSWNGGGTRPAHFDAWCKKTMGFVQPINILENEIGHVFPPVEETPHVVRLWANGTMSAQYFLLEYRKKIGFDELLPGEGLLIYHVDDNKQGNWDEEHYKVAVEQADGQFDLENNRNADSGDPWPGWSNKHEFSDRTVPDTRSYMQLITQVAVWDITDHDDNMTANLDVRFSKPWFHLLDSSFDDEQTGNGNDTLELGETIEFFFEIENEWLDAENVTVTLTPLDERIQPVVGSVAIELMEGLGAISTNDDQPLSFHIPDDMDSIRVKFQLTLDPSGPGETAMFEVEANIGGTKVLIVADDGGDLWGQYADFYTDALDSLSYTYEVWDKEDLGSPGMWQLTYPMIIWFTGDSSAASFSSADVEFLSGYLDLGGGLFLTGQDVAQHLSVVGPAFLSEYVHCSYGGSFSTMQTFVRGVEESVIGGDTLDLIIRNLDGADNQTSPDYVFAQNEDEISMKYDDGSTAALEIDADTYRVVLFGFGFEAISSSYTNFGYETRSDVMTRVVGFLNGRQPTSNRPPLAFSLVYPADGDTIETDTISLIWRSSFDFDGGDLITYEVFYAQYDSSSWQSATVTSDTTYVLTGLQAGNTYFWKVMASDNHGLATSSGETFAFESTGDITPPSFILNPMPNSVFPFEFDLMVYPSEPLQSTPVLTVTLPSGQDVNETMELLSNRDALVYVAHYRVTVAGSYDFTVCGTDEAGLDSCTGEGFSLAPIFEGEETILRSRSGLFDLTVPTYATSGNALLIMNELDADNRDIPAGFTSIVVIQAKSGVSMLQPVQLAADLDMIEMPGTDRKYLGILHLTDDGARILPTRYDEAGNRLIADIDEFGTYALVKAEEGFQFDHGPVAPSSFALGQNWPNPFNVSTSISFDLPDRARVSLVIYNLLGQKVVTLLDGHAEAGNHIINWNGKSSSGEVVSSGIYFYRLKTDAFTETKRMVLLK